MTQPVTAPENASAKDGDADDTKVSSESQNRLAELEAQVAELQQQLKDKDAKYLYLYADFDNYKKRMARERTDLIKYGWEPVARELLGIIDNLELAVAHMPANADKNLMAGLDMVLKHFRSVMEKQGIQPVVTENAAFDPNIHEAIGQEPSDRPEGTITQEHAKGYTLHGRLLRPARVMISCGGEKST